MEMLILLIILVSGALWASVLFAWVRPVQQPDHGQAAVVFHRLVLCLIASERARLEMELASGEMSVDEARLKASELRRLVSELGLNEAVDAWERVLLDADVGTVDDDLTLGMHWRVEVASALAWALQLLEEVPSPSERPDIEALWNLFPDTVAQFERDRSRAALRDESRLLAMRERLGEELLTVCAQFEMKRSDRDANLARSAALERSRAMHWLLGSYADLESVPVAG